MKESIRKKYLLFTEDNVLFICTSNFRKENQIMAKVKSFEENLNEIDEIIDLMESGELELEESIKKYENAMKLIDKCSVQLEKAEGKIKKVMEKNGELEIEDFE